MAALLMCSSSALAIPFGTFDTRSMAMAGAGVGVGGTAAAPMFNPALVSVAKKGDDFALILPTIAIGVSDTENLIRSAIDLTKSGGFVDKLTGNIATLNTALDGKSLSDMKTAANTATTVINDVSTQLSALSDKPLILDASTAVVAVIPSKNLGVAIYANATAAAGGKFVYKDAPTFKKLTTTTNCIATAATPTAATACGKPSFDKDSIKSGIALRAVALGEVGLPLSSQFYVNNQKFALGITPKIVNAILLDATVDANTTASTVDDYTAQYQFLNFDLGAAKKFDSGWTTGLVIKNVIPQTLDFKKAPTAGALPEATGEKLILNPQARIGVSHSNKWSTIAMDMDLTRNDPIGFEKKTQHIALGGELNAFGWAQLRSGYRVDMVNSARNIYTFGIGLAPFGLIHADLALAANSLELNKITEFGVSAQLGVHF